MNDSNNAVKNAYRDAMNKVAELASNEKYHGKVEFAGKVATRTGTRDCISFIAAWGELNEADVRPWEALERELNAIGLDCDMCWSDEGHIHYDQEAVWLSEEDCEDTWFYWEGEIYLTAEWLNGDELDAFNDIVNHYYESNPPLYGTTPLIQQLLHLGEALLKIGYVRVSNVKEYKNFSVYKIFLVDTYSDHGYIRPLAVEDHLYF